MCLIREDQLEVSNKTFFQQFCLLLVPVTG